MASIGPQLHPRDEDEIVAAVCAARAAGERLRAIGSGGSKSGINGAPGHAIDLDQLARHVAIDGARITVDGGMLCGAIQDALGRADLAWPTVGEWKHPTIGGAMATGTHGGTAHHGILSTSVCAVRMVTGTGEVVTLTADDPDFAHAAVSLGVLGIVTRVTLEAIPRFALRLETDVESFDHYVRDPVAVESRSEFHASVWVPTARRVIRFSADRTTSGQSPIRREQRFGNRTAISSILSRRLHLHGAISNRNFRRTAIGDSAEILSPINVSPRLARSRVVVNMARLVRAGELAFPADRASEALTRLDELFRAHPWVLNNPVGLRMAAGDDFSLSPCAGRDTLWVDLFYDATEPFVSRLRELAEELGARCHWGKKLPISSAALRAQYPQWQAFQAARARFDPDGIFANDFSDALGLTGTSDSEYPS